jgi:preprotein translocase subunit SecE
MFYIQSFAHSTIQNYKYMASVVQFIKESYEEMTQKVTWPTWSELQSSAVLVLVASFIIALVIFAMDKGANYILETFYNSL